MNKVALGKALEIVRKDIKLTAKERRRNYLVSEPNYYTTNFFTETLLTIRMSKTKILMNKPFCLRLSILELSKILMHQFLYDYLKRKYGEKLKFCYMDTDIFIVYIKTNDIYQDIAKDVESRFHT